MTNPLSQNLFEFDAMYRRESTRWIAGVDEAGRGPLAGPVVAAAVILFRVGSLQAINDSKKLTASKREKLFLHVARHGLIGIGVVDEKKIDDVNIYQATRLAMRRAVLSLTQAPDLVLIDGKGMHLDLPLKQLSVIKGDQKSAAIAAASIIAKVHRDAIMTNLDHLYPHYLFRKHKGYPTKEHLTKLKEHGPSPIHRLSYAPVKATGESFV